MNSTTQTIDPLGARDTFDTGSGRAAIYRLSRLEEAGLTKVAALPYSIRLLLEAALRSRGELTERKQALEALGSFAASEGVPRSEMELNDGSGVSRSNLLTPAALTALLVAADKAPCARRSRLPWRWAAWTGRWSIALAARRGRARSAPKQEHCGMFRRFPATPAHASPSRCW